ncbi:MAG: DUF4241 domain-containing protein [Butyrivibrio sp.]|nr:DUF4241 domain-containing protein [Butyrivibrio sp.]
MNENQNEQYDMTQYVEQNIEYVSSTELDPEKISKQFVKTESRFFLTVGTVDITSGRVAAADPLSHMSGDIMIVPILEKEIPKGSYPAEVSIYRDNRIGIRMCTARLKIKETTAVRYELAKPIPETAAFRTDDSVTCGFPVNGGVMCFIDAKGAKAYEQFILNFHKANPGANHYDDYFSVFFAQSAERFPQYQSGEGDFIEWNNPLNNERMVQISSGLGDGFYRCFWGYDETGEICELVVPMVDPDIFEGTASETEDLNTRWQEAYEANPHLYEGNAGKLIVNLTLTEDTDSLFPLVPENQWAVEGKTIDKWILSIFSLTKNRVLGTIEYHEAIKRLKPHFLAESNGWVLISGLTLEQLEGLFEGLPDSAL